MLRRALQRVLDGPSYQREQPVDSPNQVVQWWEARRLFFNAVIGCAGLITCLMVIICAVISDSMVGEAIGLPDGPLLGSSVFSSTEFSRMFFIPADGFASFYSEP